MVAALTFIILVVSLHGVYRHGQNPKEPRQISLP